MPMNPLENKGEGALELWKDNSNLAKVEGTVSGSRWEMGAQATHLGTSMMYVSLERVVLTPKQKLKKIPVCD